MEEIDPAQEIKELLNRIDKPTKKKATKKLSKITRDESRSRTLHLVFPRVDKDGNEISPYEYEITEVNLGRASKA